MVEGENVLRHVKREGGLARGTVGGNISSRNVRIPVLRTFTNLLANSLDRTLTLTVLTLASNWGHSTPA